MTRSLSAAVGAITAAFFASLCCVGPLIFVAFGVGAGLASTFEPLRPVFTVLTIALLSIAFYVVYRPSSTPVGVANCEDGATCEIPRDRTREKILLWLASTVALVFLTFPSWSQLLL